MVEPGDSVTSSRYWTRASRFGSACLIRLVIPVCPDCCIPFRVFFAQSFTVSFEVRLVGISAFESIRRSLYYASVLTQCVRVATSLLLSIIRTGLVISANLLQFLFLQERTIASPFGVSSLSLSRSFSGSASFPFQDSSQSEEI